MTGLFGGALIGRYADEDWRIAAVGVVIAFLGLEGASQRLEFEITNA